MTALRGVDVDAVTALVEHVALTVVAPRFRSLHAAEVSEKSPGDLVTVVDLAAEAALAAGLSALGPGIPVVGEEGVAADPSRLDLVASSERVWVVDPIDGTRAFVEGLPDYAVMVALVERGEPVAGWICLPQYAHTYVAVRGAGTTRNGERFTRAMADCADLRGGAATHFLPSGVRERVETNVPEIGPHAYHSARLWAGATYARIASAKEDFVLYWHTNPWDHAAGAVVIRELGGVALRLDGSDYRADDAVEGLVVACSREVAQQIMRTLDPLG